MKNILLLNLGSPKSLKTRDVRDYLDQFLSDDNVIDLPKLVQQFILRCFILPFRPAQAKEAYEEIWTKEGSPLIINTQKIADSLALKTGWNVKIAMRYQFPSIKQAIDSFKKEGIDNIEVVSLYPQHAMSTTLSTALEVKRVVNKYYPELKLNFVDPFYDHPDYIKALSESIKPHLKKFDKLILSYHGIPMRHIKKSDVLGTHCEGSKTCCGSDNEAAQKCYRSNCYHTSKLTADYLNLNTDDWMMTFQSRVSIISPEWLKPYTDKELNKLPSENIKRVGVACPSFIADCLETLEEINMRGREDFLEAGGTSFTYIPCLNNDIHFISALEKIISSNNKRY